MNWINALEAEWKCAIFNLTTTYVDDYHSRPEESMGYLALL